MAKVWIAICILIHLAEISSIDLDSSDNAWHFLKTPMEKVPLVGEDIIIVIGKTGSGKSTLVHYVAGDYSQITAVDNGEMELEVYDGLDPQGGTMISATESRTQVPEVVIDENGYQWIDCPGFDDTRSMEIEVL